MASIPRSSPSNFSVRYLRQRVRKSHDSIGRKMKTVPFTDSERLKRDVRSMLRARKKATDEVPPVLAVKEGEQARNEGANAGHSPPARSRTRLPRGFGRNRVPLLSIGGDVSVDIGSETLNGTKCVPSEPRTSRPSQDHSARVRERRQQQLDRWRETLQRSLARLTENELKTSRDAFVSRLTMRQQLVMERQQKHLQELERKRLLQDEGIERPDRVCAESDKVGGRRLDSMSNTACAEPLNMKGVSFESRQTKNSFWVPTTSRLDINVGPDFRFRMSRFGRTLLPSVMYPKR